MKILHLCLACFYIDNCSYQENLLPKYHKKMGHDVEIIASLVSFNKNGKTCLLEHGSRYINEYGIPVTRLEYKKSLFSKRLRQYKGTFEAIQKSRPDIIFIHGCQFLDIKYVEKYVRDNPHVKVFVDNHADFSNSARNWLSKNIFSRIIWRHCAQLVEPFTEKFYGVLPARVDFLLKMFDLPQNKVKLLVMGADDEQVSIARSKQVRESFREKYGIDKKSFLIITGGKIDSAKKQTLLLMKAIRNIEKNNITLLVFGSIAPEIKKDFDELLDNKRIKYIGWISLEDSYKCFAAADLAVFPGRHSVYWEQAVGSGVPCIFKWWEGTTHVDLGGNCQFLHEDSVETIQKKIQYLIDNPEQIKTMRDVAEKRGMEAFSYRAIAKKSINI